MKTNKQFLLQLSTTLALLVVRLGLAPTKADVAARIGQNFTGTSDSSASAPCPAGAVNADYFVELNINTFNVYKKSDGSTVSSMNWRDFWSQAGVIIPVSYGRATPRVVYDPTVRRWFIAEDAGDDNHATTTDHLLLAISSTEDPTGAWNGVSMPADPGGGNQAVWVAMGLDARGLYLSGVVGPPGGGPAVGCTLLSLPKADLLLIPPVTTNRTWFGTLSAAKYGYNVKPVICLDGSAGGDILATAGRGVPGDNNNTLFAFAVQNGGGPGLATLTSPKALSVAPYVSPDNSAQPDGSTDLVTWNATFTGNAFRVGDWLFAAHPIQVGPHSGIGWYRLSATQHTVLESGVLTDPTLDLYYPSIAANTNGTVVIACDGSSTNTFVSCYAAVGQTVNGVTTFGKLLLLQSGVASYQNLDSNGDNLWGYYSTTCVDPTDANAFWTINAYASGLSTWSTQITQLITSPSPQLSIVASGSNLLLTWPATPGSFQVEMTPSLGQGSHWLAVSQPLLTSNTAISVLVPRPNTNTFYRLVQTQ